MRGTLFLDRQQNWSAPLNAEEGRLQRQWRTVLSWRLHKHSVSRPPMHMILALFAGRFKGRHTAANSTIVKPDGQMQPLPPVAALPQSVQREAAWSTTMLGALNLGRDSISVAQPATAARSVPPRARGSSQILAWCTSMRPKGVTLEARARHHSLAAAASEFRATLCGGCIPRA